MKSPKRYYKVIRKETRTSATATPSIQLTYPKGQWVEPILPHSKIFVFSNLDDACHFAEEYPSFSYAVNSKKKLIVNNPSTLIVVPCFVKNPRMVHSALPVIGDDERKNYLLLKKYWTKLHELGHPESIGWWDQRVWGKYTSKKGIHVIDPPYGTMLCDAVMCLK